MDHDAIIIEYMDGNTQLPARVQWPPNTETFTSANAELRRHYGITTQDQARGEGEFRYREMLHEREAIGS
jgi:hypothetical protein